MVERMTIEQILNDTLHRPWPLPTTSWKYYQEWNDAIFLHWKVDFNILNKFVPREIEIDMFEDSPWISLVAFTMDKVRMQNLPSFPPISCFNEINIRTYVRHNNKAGVYFLSIEGGTALSCTLAKVISQLPYRYSMMKRSNGHYRSRNSRYGDKFETTFEIGQPIKVKSQLDRWLTERYALFQDTPDSINEFEIHHIEWPTYQIDLKSFELEYSRFDRLICGAPSVAHYSSGVQVLGWSKRVKKR